MIRWIRRLAGMLAIAYAVYQLVGLLAPRPIFGVLPWGDPTGLRISPLGPAEAAAARTREQALARRWEGELTASSNV